MPVLPKFLRCRGISSSTKKIVPKAKPESGSGNSIEEDVQPVELPSTPTEVRTVSYASTPRMRIKSESYKAIPVFKTVECTVHQEPSAQGASGCSSSTSTSTNSQQCGQTDKALEPNLAVGFDDGDLNAEIARLHRMLDVQAEQAIRLHTEDTFEMDRLRISNRDLMRQIKNLQLQLKIKGMNKMKAGKSDQGAGSSSAQQSHKANTSTQCASSQTEPLPNDEATAESNALVHFGQVQYFEY